MAIQALRAGSAPGDNGLAATLLKKGGPGATTLIHTAITAAWRSGEASAEWKDACMHAIYKGRGSRTSMDAYRPQHRCQGLRDASPPPPPRGHGGPVA